MIPIFQKAFDMVLYIVQSELFTWLFTLVMIVLLAKLIVFIFSSR